MTLKRIKNILILVQCLVYVLMKGSARTIPKNIKKVGIMQMAKLGDMVCTTPLFSSIKDEHPDWKVCVIGKESQRDILNGNEDVDEYIPISPSGIFSENLKKIKAANIDVGLLTAPSFIGLALLYLSGIKFIVAPLVKENYSPQQTIPYRILQKFVVSRDYYFDLYVPALMLKLLEPLGIYSKNTKKNLSYTEESAHYLESIVSGFDEEFIIGLSVSSGNKIKNWGGLNFALMSSEVSKIYNCRFVLVGSRIDRLEVEEFLKHLSPSVKITNLSEKLNLDQLKALIDRLDLFVSVDTGPIYVAEALGTPTIDIVGPVSEKEQPPAGELHRIVKIDRDKPAIHILNARMYDYKEAKRQIEEITPMMVVKEVIHIISKL